MQGRPALNSEWVFTVGKRSWENWHWKRIIAKCITSHSQLDYWIWMVTNMPGHLVDYWTECSKQFWKTNIFASLTWFYFNCLLSDIALPRHFQGLPVREWNTVRTRSSKETPVKYKTKRARKQPNKTVGIFCYNTTITITSCHYHVDVNNPGNSRQTHIVKSLTRVRQRRRYSHQQYGRTLETSES